LRAFTPYALPFLALAVMSATIWRTWTFRLSAIPLALIGIVGATQGPRYDVIVAPSGDLAAVRDADGALEVVGKRFNAFAAEQWLTADGDGRDPAQARAFDAPCDRLGCVAALPEGESLSIVLDSLAFDEDCARAEVVVSALSAPAGCKAKFLFDEQALARLGAVGLTWSDKGFTLASGRSPLENRPWSPAPAAPRDDRIVRPGHGASRGADPADVGDEPGEAR
jgi:competence protein ComEC